MSKLANTFGLSSCRPHTLSAISSLSVLLGQFLFLLLFFIYSSSVSLVSLFNR